MKLFQPLLLNVLFFSIRKPTGIHNLHKRVSYFTVSFSSINFCEKSWKNVVFHNSSTRFLGRRVSGKCSIPLRNQDWRKSAFTISRGDFSFVKSSKMQKRESCQGESTSDPFFSYYVYFHLQWGNQFQKKPWPLKG